MPLIGPMCGVGILKGLLTILTSCGILSTTDGTYILLYNAADSYQYSLHTQLQRYLKLVLY